MKKTSLNSLFWFWNGVNILLFALAASRQSTNLEVLNRYTRVYALGLLLALVLVIFVFAFSLWGSERFAALLARVPSAGIIAGALVLFGAITAVWSVPFDGFIIKVLFTVNVICFGLWSADAFPPSTDGGIWQFWQPALAAILAVMLLVALFSAHEAPLEQSSGDEAAWTNMAVTWQESRLAYFRLSVWEPLPISPGYGYWIVGLAGWLQVFGISLASGRLFMWVVYALGVLTITAAGWRLYDRWVGLFAGIITAGSTYVLSTRIVRPELGLAIVGALLLLVYLRKQPAWALAAGLLATLSLEIHASGLAYILGIGAMYATDLFLKRSDPLRFRRFGFFIVGSAIGGALYSWLNILALPDPAYFFDSLRSQRGFLNGYDWQWFQRAAVLYGERAPLEMIFVALGVIGLVIRRGKSDRLLLRFLAFTAAAYAVFVPGGERYLILFAPFFYVGIASLFRFGLEAVSAERRMAGSVLAACSLCAPCIVLMSAAVQPNLLAEHPMPAHVGRVQEQVDSSAVVVGDINDYWWFTEHPQFYNNGAEYDHNLDRLDDGTEFWARLQPDIVYFTSYPGNPQIAPLLKRWIDEMDYTLIDTVQSDGFTTLIWQRPGYVLQVHAINARHG